MRSTYDNVGPVIPEDFEGRATLAVGGMIVLAGLMRKSFGGLLIAAAGGALVSKALRDAEATRYGVARHGVNAPPANRELTVEKAITINRPREEVYDFWRNLENLPRFMHHLEEVEVIDERRSRWLAKAPLGMHVSWDAEITDERENEMIAWRSLAGSTVENHGRVEFTDAPGNRGTEIRVQMFYAPPAGKVGATLATLFGEEPRIQIDDDLRRLRSLLETGDVPSIEGQTSERMRAGEGPDAYPA